MSQLRAHNKPPTTPMTFSVLVTLICVLLLYYIDANQTNPVIKTTLYTAIRLEIFAGGCFHQTQTKDKIERFEGFGTITTTNSIRKGIGE
jgi:hypothetical protein